MKKEGSITHWSKSLSRPLDRPAMTIAVDLTLKATKQTNKQNPFSFQLIQAIYLVEG